MPSAAVLILAVLSILGNSWSLTRIGWMLPPFSLCFVFPYTGRAPIRKPLTGFKGSVGAVGEHQPQHAELRPVPQVFLRQRFWRKCLPGLPQPLSCFSMRTTLSLHLCCSAQKEPYFKAICFLGIGWDFRVTITRGFSLFLAAWGDQTMVACVLRYTVSAVPIWRWLLALHHELCPEPRGFGSFSFSKVLMVSALKTCQCLVEHFNV